MSGLAGSTRAAARRLLGVGFRGFRRFDDSFRRLDRRNDLFGRLDDDFGHDNNLRRHQFAADAVSPLRGLFVRKIDFVTGNP